jgi:hypothetical protein
MPQIVAVVQMGLPNRAAVPVAVAEDDFKEGMKSILFLTNICGEGGARTAKRPVTHTSWNSYNTRHALLLP